MSMTSPLWQGVDFPMGKHDAVQWSRFDYRASALRSRSGVLAPSDSLGSDFFV